MMESTVWTILFPAENRKDVNTRQSKGKGRTNKDGENSGSTQEILPCTNSTVHSLPDLAAQHGGLHKLSLTTHLLPWDGGSQIQALLVGTTNKAEIHLLSQLEQFKHEGH